MCSTLLQVSEDQLAVKHGKVRCGHCNEVFDASDHCYEQIQAAMSPPQQPIADPPPLEPTAEAEILDTPNDDVADLAAETEVIAAKQTVDPVPWEGTPHQTSIMSKSRFMLWSMALLALLSIQLWHFERDQILHSAPLRPHLESIAQAIQVELPLYEERAKLSIIERELRPHPEQSNALRFRLTVQNLAAFSQSYPVVRLSLNDEQQRVVAQANFQPGDYLSNEQIKAGIPPQSSAQMTIDFIAPQQSVGGFLFDLI